MFQSGKKHHSFFHYILLKILSLLLFNSNFFKNFSCEYFLDQPSKPFFAKKFFMWNKAIVKELSSHFRDSMIFHRLSSFFTFRFWFVIFRLFVFLFCVSCSDVMLVTLSRLFITKINWGLACSNSIFSPGAIFPQKYLRIIFLKIEFSRWPNPRPTESPVKASSP